MIVERDGEPDERVFACLEVRGATFHPGQARLDVIQLGGFVIAIEVRRQRLPPVDGVEAERLVKRRYVLFGGLRQIGVEEHQPFGLVDHGFETPLDDLHALRQEGHIPVLVARLALHVGLFPFLRKPVQALRSTEELRRGYAVVPEILSDICVDLVDQRV